MKSDEERRVGGLGVDIYSRGPGDVILDRGTKLDRHVSCRTSSPHHEANHAWQRCSAIAFVGQAEKGDLARLCQQTRHLILEQENSGGNLIRIIRYQGAKTFQTRGQTERSVSGMREIVEKSMDTLPTAYIDDTIAMQAG